MGETTTPAETRESQAGHRKILFHQEDSPNSGTLRPEGLCSLHPWRTPRPNMEGLGLAPEVTLLLPEGQIQTSCSPFPPQLPHDPASASTPTLAPLARTSSPTSLVPHYETVMDPPTAAPSPWHSLLSVQLERRPGFNGKKNTDRRCLLKY